VAVLGGVGFFGIRNAMKSGPPGATLAERYAADDRIAPLLQPCAFGKPFEGDTTAIAEALVSKLGVGAQLEPLRRAKQDLAQMGPEVEAPLRRLFEESSREMFLTGVALNVLDVCSLTDEPWGVSIARQGLVANREDVRTRASYVFRNHGSLEDYEALKIAFLACNAGESAERYVPALKHCDEARFHYDVPDFMDRLRKEAGALAESTLADALAIASVDAVDPAVADRLFERSVGLAPRHRAYMIAPSAAVPGAANAEAALHDLRAWLSDPLPLPRQNAATALAHAGLPLEVAPLVNGDSDSRTRALAAALLEEGLRNGKIRPDDVRGVLRGGMSDEDPSVVLACLAGLLTFGDEFAWAEVLRRLEQSFMERDAVTRVLRGAWKTLPPEAADQARQRLLVQWERLSGAGAPSSELLSVLRAIGSVPGRESGVFLLDVAMRLQDQTIGGINGFRWSVSQAYNAGPEARAVILERLAKEADPFRRLDLISHVWQIDSPEAVEVLLELVSDTKRDVHERLFAAERLLYMGAAPQVAPALKAVYWETTDAVLRPGLHCLLWNWYGVRT